MSFRGAFSPSRVMPQRFIVSPQFIVSNEASLGAGVNIPVRSDRIRLTLTFKAQIFADGELLVTLPGQYRIKRSIDNLTIRMPVIPEFGPALESALGRHGICLIDVYAPDVEFEDINPDLLPVGVFGITSQTITVGNHGTGVNSTKASWTIGNLAQDSELPTMIFCKNMIAWIEAPAGAPPQAGSFVYDLRLSKTASDASESYRLLQSGGGGALGNGGLSAAMGNAMLPIRELYRPRGAETPILQWLVDTNNAVGADMIATAAVTASYLR